EGLKDAMERTGSNALVMDNYRASGGGNFFMFQNKPVVKDIPTDMSELIANYILEHKTIEAESSRAFFMSAPVSLITFNVFG
ncbi:hypothetical protein ACT4US_24790, partial [Bacillus sp. HC-Mk]